MALRGNGEAIAKEKKRGKFAISFSSTISFSIPPLRLFSQSTKLRANLNSAEFSERTESLTIKG